MSFKLTTAVLCMEYKHPIILVLNFDLFRFSVQVVPFSMKCDITFNTPESFVYEYLSFSVTISHVPLPFSIYMYFRFWFIQYCFGVICQSIRQIQRNDVFNGKETHQPRIWHDNGLRKWIMVVKRLCTILHCTHTHLRLNNKHAINAKQSQNAQTNTQRANRLFTKQRMNEMLHEQQEEKGEEKEREKKGKNCDNE